MTVFSVSDIVGVSRRLYHDVVFAEHIRRNYGLAPVPDSWMPANAQRLANGIEQLGGEVRAYERSGRTAYFASEEDIDAAKAMVTIERNYRDD